MKGSIERKKVGRSEPKIAMYPKVRVPCQVKEDEDEVRYQTQRDRDSSLYSNNPQSPFSENNEEDDSQVSVAKIPKVYLPSVSVSGTCISDVIRGSSTRINKRDTKPPYQKTKATPIQRPRAIVSSPDNDAMIGSINKIEERKKKKKGLKE